MGKYTEDSKEMLKLIGGKENIAAVSHCVTRMRFVLNDPKIADVPGLEKMKVVKGTFTQAGQFQVIIGNTVADFYDDFTEVAGVSGVSKDQVKNMSKQNQNPLQRLMTAIAEIFAPLIPALITGGLILGFRNVIGDIDINSAMDGMQAIKDTNQFWSGMYDFLWLIGEAVFHVGIPVGICWSVMKKMGGTEILGIILGITLVSGQLLNAYAVASTAAEDIPVWNFGFAKVAMIGYQAQVIPAILAAFALVYLERFFKKIVPTVISMILVPFCSLLLAVMAAHFILGPIGWKVGSAISAVVYAGITGSFRVVFGALFGFFYAPLVITGLHHMTNAIDTQLVADFGGTMLWPMIALSNIAQGSAVLGMIYLQRKDAEKQEVNVPSGISCYLGVTEPAMFGVNLKYVFPFICGMIGSCVAGIFSTALRCTANSIGVGGLPGILSMQSQSMLPYLFCMCVAVVVPFILTVVVGKTRGVDKEAAEAALLQEQEKAAEEALASEEVRTIMAPVSGKVISLESINDGVFSSKALGDGVGIIPEDGVVVAPCSAKVTTLIDDSKHAVGLALGNGMELLIHVGLDTVDMKGKGFAYKVGLNEVVKTGDPLIIFDRAEIEKAGHPDTVVFVVTDAGENKVAMHSGRNVEAARDAVMTVG
ncbi:MAG: PTS system trehalose-specific EIIBC component [Lachnospiraceae bacterium]|nr:PTS system trehalose-specific EIIBC component [Lachnospiraceae bacterium]